MDFINDGSHDGPLIRLLSDQKNEIELLRSYFVKLGTMELEEVTISDLPISNSRIKLMARVCNTGNVIKMSKDKKEFTVEMSTDSWLEMAKKLAPFLIDQTGFAWLYESKSMYLLFTTDGYW